MENKSVAVAAEDERRHPPPPPSPTAPWLVMPFQEGGNNHNQAFYSICEPNNKTIRRSIPELSSANRFYQKSSHQGWLVVRSNFREEPKGDCFLWNPISLEVIMLPHLQLELDSLYDEVDVYHVKDCVLSSPPLKDASGNVVKNYNSMVYFLVLGSKHDNSYNMLMYCRVGDTKWRILEITEGFSGDDTMSTLICLNGSVYIMCRSDNYQLLVEKLVLPYDTCGFRLRIKRLAVSFVYSDFRYIGGYTCLEKVSFMESYGQIYRIEMVCFDRRGYLKNLVVSVNVARLDFSEMSWKEVNSLGDTVLFLGKNTNASCSATELGLGKGCLYYSLPNDRNLCIYHVEDKSTTTILPFSELPTPCFTSQWIMMPLPSLSVGVEGRTVENISSKVRQDDYSMMAVKTEEIISIYGNRNLRRKQDEEDVGEVGPWVTVSNDIWDCIASRLHPAGILQFRAVCSEIKDLFPIVKVKQIAEDMRSMSSTPWLLFSTENTTRYNFVDLVHNNEKYSMHLPDLTGAIIRCQKGGWLLMSKGRFTLFFYNPFTKQTIQLPKLPNVYCFSGISFSSLPTCSDCVVFGITQANEVLLSIFIIQRGADQWRFGSFQNSDLEKFMPSFNGPVFSNGVFHCVDFNGTLGIYGNRGDWRVLETPRGFSNAAYVSYLVECDGVLLLVQLLGMSVTVLAFDVKYMVWRKVNSLRKFMLFTSFTSCISAVAPESWMENKVYFPRLHDEGILYYSLETGSYHAVGSTNSARDYFDTKGWTNCTWIQPNWSLSTPQQLDWLNGNPLNQSKKRGR